MRLNPRQLVLALPVLAPALLIALWAVLAAWSGGLKDQTGDLRRQLQLVRVNTPLLQAIKAARDTPLARADAQTGQNGVAYAIMEDTLRASGLSDTVRQIRPEVRDLETQIEEQLSLNLTQLDRPQLMRFLYDTRRALPEMSLDSLAMRRNNNGFMDIDAVFLLRRPK